MSKYLLIQIILLTFAVWIVGSHDPMTRGKSVAPSALSMTDITKTTDIMSKKSTTEEFVTRAEKKHPNIDFSKVRYVNSYTDVTLVCKVCGLEWETDPHSTLKGCGCPHCSRTKLIYGVGINDDPQLTVIGRKTVRVYQLWKGMLERCYSARFQSQYPTYVGCTVCEEWKFFSNFKKWTEEKAEWYRDGYDLDKDILSKGAKVYSPDTCCFVPASLNRVIVGSSRRRRSGLPVGVWARTKCKRHRFCADVNVNGKRERARGFDTAEEAYAFYKQAKEEYIRSLAEKYFREGKIEERVYNALMNYQVRNDV